MNTKPQIPLARAGIVFGLGLGGLFDGIVLHQILGWHHMICTTETCQPNSIGDLQRQITQDGFFDFSVWILTSIGVILLFRAARQQMQAWSGKIFFGAILAGWGAFNFVEGLIYHQILGVHHVLPGHANQFFFDMLFLASGLLLAVAGCTMMRSESSQGTATAGKFETVVSEQR